MAVPAVQRLNVALALLEGAEQACQSQVGSGSGDVEGELGGLERRLAALGLG